MQDIYIEPDFEHWRIGARSLLAAGIRPDEICWIEVGDQQAMLPGFSAPTTLFGSVVRSLNVPKSFLQMARLASCFRDSRRWLLLYRVLWRLTHGEPQLMRITVDDDVYALLQMGKGVRRDAHKMKAFVRFRRVEKEEAEEFVAWHRPDHLIVRHVAPFFADRFAPMRWTILTPDASVAWDQKRLTYGPGVNASAAPDQDPLEEMWKTYYASIFNPARLNVSAMQKEMPKKHWGTLPESMLIPDLIHDAPKRVEAMMKKAAARSGATGDTRPVGATSAAGFLPKRRTLPQLREAAVSCKGCDLYCHATQTVFGQGPVQAKLMLIGEQPGDQEDLAGRPFVGPSGLLLDEALQAAGILRDDVYVTNAVKHFKFEPRGTRRIHAKPSAREVQACRPWLEAELEVVRPRLIVCLGATAAQTLLGAQFRLTKHRGEFMQSDWAPLLLATNHPAAILRVPDEKMRESARREFFDDIRAVAVKLREAI